MTTGIPPSTCVSHNSDESQFQRNQVSEMMMIIMVMIVKLVMVVLELL